MRDAIDARNYRRFAVGWWLFIVYGSLIPFQYRDIAWPQAIDFFFRHLPWLDIDEHGRADWIANFVLYLPLGFAGMAALARRNKGWVLPWMLACCATAVGVEFTQIFFAPRTVSANDIVAEMIGSAAGIAGWLHLGQRFDHLIHASRGRGPHRLRSALILYLVLYVGLALFPYDFIISRAELSRKLESGAIYWTLDPGGSALRNFVTLAGHALLLAPLGLYAGHAWGRRKAIQVFALAVMLGAAIELLQLFEVSGITDGLSVLARGLGALGGYLAVPLLPRLNWTALRRFARPAILLAVPVYGLALALVRGWHPGNLADAARIRDLWAETRLEPFYYFYFVPEERALASFLALFIEYAPIGLMTLAWQWAAGRAMRAQPAVLLAAVAAFGIEAGALLFGGLRPDPSAVWIAAFGAFALHGLGRWLIDALAVATPPAKAPGTPSPAPLGSATRTPPPAPAPIPFARPAPWQYGLALPPVLAVAAFLARFPTQPILVGLLFALYAWQLWRRPNLWLLVVPAALPVFDLAPFSGWFFFDEFDALVLLTIAVLVLRQPPRRADLRFGSKFTLLAGVVALATLIALVRGLLPLSPLDDNAFAHYYSHYNALRVAKGFGWALLLAPFLATESRISANGVPRMLRGFLLGLFGVGLIALFERWLFPGLFNLTSPYRVTASFSSMHTGDGHIDMFLAGAIPMLAVLAFDRAPLRLAALGLLTFHTLVATGSRAPFLAAIAALMVLAVGLWMASRKRRSRSARWLPATGGIVLVALFALPILAPTLLAQRFDQTAADADIRLVHLKRTIGMMDDDMATQILGMGLGRFPETYFWRNTIGDRLASYSFADDNGRHVLRMSAGNNLYMGQRVSIRPHRTYVLSMDVRASQDADIGAPICEKWLLDSFECIWLNLPVHGRAGDAWQHIERTFDSGDVSAPLGHFGRLSARPTELAVFVQNSGALVDIDNVSLRQGDTELLRNGNFSAGSDHWFWTADDHLPWHIKNMIGDQLFAQGWLGLIALLALLAHVLGRLARGLLAGERTCAVLFAALVGMLVVGVTCSLFDQPRLTTMFYLLLAAAALQARHAPVAPH